MQILNGQFHKPSARDKNPRAGNGAGVLKTIMLINFNQLMEEHQPVKYSD